MHLWGIFELRGLGKLEHRSVDGGDFATTMSERHEQVKQRSKDTSNNYKK